MLPAPAPASHTGTGSVLPPVGSFYVDRSEGSVYYRARPEDGNMSKASAVVPAQEQVLELQASHRVSISGLSLQYSAWTWI